MPVESEEENMKNEYFQILLQIIRCSFTWAVLCLAHAITWKELKMEPFWVGAPGTKTNGRASRTITAFGQPYAVHNLYNHM